MEKMRLWLQSLSQQQRVLFLFLFMSVTYFIWTSIWADHYTSAKTVLDSQTKDLQDKLNTITTARQKMKALQSDPDVLATQKKLESLRKQLKEISRRLVSSKQMLDQLRGVFAKDPDIKFSHIQNMGTIPFSLEAPGQEPNKTDNTANPNVKPPAPFYEHVFVITFEASYFATERYIKQLQTLPGQLYFDSIDYQVLKYPAAVVTLKVHTISTDEGLIDA